MAVGLSGQQITDGAITDADVAAANKDGVAGTPSMRTLGTGAQVACAGDDARLSNARTPIAHKDTHKASGSDGFLATDLLEAVVKRILEGGSTTLLVGSIPDGLYLKRSGTGIIGETPTAAASPDGFAFSWFL